MPVKLSACIEMIYGNVPEFTERIAKVGAVGLKAFEFWGWSNKDMPAVRAKADELGLAIAAWIVDRHAGSIRVTDAEAGGARFEVRLPGTAG